MFIICKTIFIIIFVIYSLNISNPKKYSIYLEQKYDSRDAAFNKSKNFLKICLSNELFKFQSSYDFNEPKVSVVIPMNNCENFIIRAVKSVQYQNLSNIEILLIDDNSTDNTLSIVENMKNNDRRIRIIKNKKNMGILYSRSVGVLSSIGKYIFTLDNDDLFLNYDIFDTITKIAEEGKFDIVEFKAISNENYEEDILNTRTINSNYSQKQPMILFQPELGRFPIFIGNNASSYGFRDIYLWGKCIKSDIYQKSLNKLGLERYSRFMIRYEDILANYMIFNTAESYLFIEKYGIYHIRRVGSGAEIGLKKVPRINNLAYLVDIVIDFSQNNVKNKKLMSHLIIIILLMINAYKLLLNLEF